MIFFFFQAEDGIRDLTVTGVQTCALPISRASTAAAGHVQRARMVLLAAEGLSNAEIGRRVGMTRQTVISWRGPPPGRGGGPPSPLPPAGPPPRPPPAAGGGGPPETPPPPLGGDP